MADSPQRGSAAWLANQAAQDQATVSRAARYVSAGHRSNDACLQARRYLEWRWRLDPLRLPGEQAWRDAAVTAERRGNTMAASVLHAGADVDSELRAIAAAWITRHSASPVTGSEEVLARLLADGIVRPSGTPVPGVDGSMYQLAEAQPAPGYPAELAVLITTMTGRELAAGFAEASAALAWMSGRARAEENHSRARHRSLEAPALEHLPRVTLEEHALAWALRHSGTLSAAGVELAELTWTADCRREIAAALHTATSRRNQAGAGDVAAQLTRRMLRAPGWAADQIGWPAGAWIQHYLTRLSATPVTETAARHAIAVLTLDSPEPGTSVLAELARKYGAEPGRQQARVWPAPASPARPATALDQRAAGLYARYGPYYDRPDSLGSRVRITRPGPQP